MGVNMKDSFNKSITIYQDQRIAEEFCNFRCEYCEGFCPSGYSLNKDKNGNLKVPAEWYEKISLLPKQVEKYFVKGPQMDNFYDLALEVLEKAENILCADILKISGGEITTNKNLVDFVRKIHSKYSVIQILTNGFNLIENEIDEYKNMKNVTFQISIDGVTAKSNYAKSHNEKITKKVLENIDYIIKQNIGLEINCVLTKYNINTFSKFLERFKNANNFIIVPRPVRGAPREILNFTQEQVNAFEKFLNEEYDMYSKILPPKAYIDRLISIMKKNKRTMKCYIPFFVQSIDGYGNLEECPIGLITKCKNNVFMLENSQNYSLNHKVFVDNSICENCTNQYEMFNLYVEGLITKEELRKIPSLNSKKIIEHIDYIKTDIIKCEMNRILKEKYNIVAERIELNEESTDGNVYVAYCEKNKYIIKLYNELKHTEAMIKLHNELELLNLNTPRIIVTSDNRKYEKILHNNYLVIYSFLNGKAISWNPKTGKLDYNIIISIAKELKKFHENTRNNSFGLPQLLFKNDGKRKSALHFDLTKNNIFELSNNQIGFIDFDDAKFGDSVCDIAIFIANLFFSKTRGVDLDGMRKFIDEYYGDETNIRDDEKTRIKEYALCWIDYILNVNEFDTSTTESLEIRKKMINDNL